jgi:leader peptidase (prepilin peptidase)/N-methyltransferase
MKLDVAHLIALVGPAYLLAVAIPLSIIDIKQRRLPNKLTLPALPIALAGQFLASALSQRWIPMLIAFVWMIGGFAFALTFNRLNALGMGDVKLIAVICLNLGWFGWLWPVMAIATAFGAATLFTLLMFSLGRYRMTSTIPLGPYLLAGVFASTIGLVSS